MFGNPIKKIRMFKPGDRVQIVSTGKIVEIIMKGDGTNIGVKDVENGNTWNISGEVAARAA